MRLIDADALEEFVKEKCSYCTNFIGEEDVLAWIDKAPTIELNESDLDIDYSIEYANRPNDRPKGEWLNDGLEAFGIRTAYICSCCGYSTRYNKDFKNTTNYCPCCGARMKRGAE